MTKFFKDQTIKEFLDSLSSKTPTPGGGSASALAGAMASALVVMVAEFTLGKEKYKDQEEKIRGISDKSKVLQMELFGLVDADSEAYEEVVRTKGSQPAVKKAAEVPLTTAQKSLEVLKMAEYVSEFGNQNLRSDAFVAMELAQAAVYGALENVRINLPFIKDEKEAEKLKCEVEKVLDGTNGLVKP